MACLRPARHHCCVRNCVHHPRHEADSPAASIASGLLGAKSYNGGWTTAALGLACHFFIALSAATIFYLASRNLKLMTRYPIFSGALYGVMVYTVMYWIVVPTVFGPRPFNWSVTMIAVITHIVCVGTPISLMVYRYST